MRVSFVLALTCCAVVTATAEGLAASNETTHDWIRWDRLPPLPNARGLSGAYVGVSHGALIVAGGASFVPSSAEGRLRYEDGIFVLEPGSKSWRTAGSLPRPAGYGTAVTAGGRVVCLGGRNDAAICDDVFTLEWNPKSNSVAVRRMPSLPAACYEGAAGVLDQTLYFAAGRNDAGPLSRFWSLPIAGPESSASTAHWTELPTYPSPARYGAVMIVQSNGETPCLYLIGGQANKGLLRQVDRYAPRAARRESAWTRCAELPWDVYLPAAAAWGQSHILLFGGSASDNRHRAQSLSERVPAPRAGLAYHTITDTWVKIGELPLALSATSAVKWHGALVIPGGDIGSGRSSVDCYRGVIEPLTRRFGLLDYAVIAGYLLAIVVIGLSFSGRNRSTDDFFLGGRQIPWWAAGLSLLATQVSSIGIMAIPAKTYAANWTYITGIATWFVVVPIVTRVFIPFFRRLDVTSAYEYLEARFSSTLRLFASLTYCLLQLGRLAVVLYLPALALASVTGIDVIVAVVIMGGVCTFITVIGGMKAVVWTEVFQALILIGGIFACLVAVMTQLDDGLLQIIDLARHQQKLQTVEVGWDAFHATLWVVLLGNLFIRFSNLTADQAVVQRYLTTRNERQARLALWTDVMISIPWALLVFSLGTALYVFYRIHPQALNPNVDVDGIVPFFIAQQLPAGVSGMVVAAIIAAAMSTLNSYMHSVATLLVTDLGARLSPRSTESGRLRSARWIILLIGFFSTASAVALAMANIGSLWDWAQSFMGLFAGGLAGFFLLGVFTTRANSSGALFGAFVSALVLAYATYSTHVHFFLYSPIGIATCFVAGYLASLVLPGRRQIIGLTAFTMADNR